MKLKGFVRRLDEWEDAGYALFDKKNDNNLYNYSDEPTHDLMQILDQYLGKEITINIKESKR